MATKLTNKQRLQGYIGETFVLMSLLSYLILIVQDINAVLLLDSWLNAALWFGVLKGMVKYFVLFLLGILTHVYKKMQETEIEKRDKSEAQKETAQQELARAYMTLQNACLASDNPDLITAAKNTSVDIIGKGVDLFDLAQKREARLVAEKQGKTTVSSITGTPGINPG